ncbi:hypothetical protein TH63_06285 [Rufibacter radiotolerans]|uniref:Lipid/polyisoprenoid-binding YceI-like domain-containing protein n=1 Tax=Rufibacter radiotolerans TaxID=1379910 RepID=A0A0H4VN91_9BACT|nr:YceI family protein [Rufibacter radiotolerans]AKQ45332.1 hypothetical protein TH63_06285 [Rufibacter radiotolerans]
MAVTIWPVISAQAQGSVQNDKAGSSISYILVHPFHTVTGVSHQVSSTLVLGAETDQIQAVQVTVPVKSFDSGNRARDKDMRKTTEADTYQEVTFKSTNLTQTYGSLQVQGQLGFHGVTKDISFEATFQQKNSNLVVKGQFPISLEAYQIKRPSIFKMKVKDELTVKFQMVYPLAKQGN